MVRWGTRLHDRFMLPQPLQDDFEDVLQILNRPATPSPWISFHPHFEFRFPIYGRTTFGGMEIELRQALEPWHVLGEEPGGGGTARYVDSSVERLQVKVSGMTGGRHIITCNGRRVPLQPTGAEDGSLLPAFVTVPGSRRAACTPPSGSTPRWWSICSTPGPTGPWAAAPTT
jgi:uncharacterized protein (DUF2126 family)